MRQGQQNRRGRGRNNNNNNNNNSNNNNNNGRKPQNPLGRTYESSGPDVKIRGTAAQIAEKYIALARDASSSSDVIMAENYLQHAEHYNRIIMAAQAQQQQQQQQPSLSGHHGGENGHDRSHVSNAPQRISPEANGAMRDQPQPVIQSVIVEAEAPAAAVVADSAAEQPVQQAAQPAPREPAREDGRRRRRRYPASGTGDRASAGPADANGADIVKSDRSADEAIA